MHEIVCLPLVRLSALRQLNTPHHHLGFFVRQWSNGVRDKQRNSSGTDGKLRSLIRDRVEGLVDKASNKWESYSTAPPESISGRIYSAGNRLMDRIDADEWFLKEIPSTPTAPIRLIYPFKQPDQQQSSSLIFVDPTGIKDRMSELIQYRAAYHRRYRSLSITCIPVSMALGLLPMPNVFLAYNLFRVYSHDKAMNGANRLSGDNGAIEMEMTPNRLLGELLEADDRLPDEKRFQLAEITMEQIAEQLKMPRYFLHDIRRATKQAAATIHHNNTQ